jgi:N-acetylmuramoyl-L-alanine amidase
MSKLGRICAITAIISLAGCVAQPKPKRTRVSDWESEKRTNLTVSHKKSEPEAATGIAPALPSQSADDRETWISLSRWCRKKGLASPSQISNSIPLEFELRTTNGLFAFRIGEQAVRWKGTELRLGFAPVLIDSRPFFHTLDLKKNLEPLIEVAPLNFPMEHPVIVLDPGHGGMNAGTRSILSNNYEKEFTLDWALRLRPLLAAKGWRVFLTRTNDTDLSLSNRVAFAEDHHADLFVSLHFNSAGGGDRHAGLETYCLSPEGMPSTVTRGFPDDLGVSFPNNVFDAANLQLALLIHRALLSTSHQQDRGIRRARFLGVLRNQHRPAILVEGGYLSNSAEARHIADPEFRQQLAAAMAGAFGQIAGTTERPLGAKSAATAPGLDASVEPSTNGENER